MNKYEDDEEDEIKLAKCGQVEAEVRDGKVGVRYVKDVKRDWTPVVRRKISARCESGDTDLDMDGKNWWSRDASGSLEFVSTGELLEWGSGLLWSPALFIQGLELNSNINNYGKYCSKFSVLG